MHIQKKTQNKKYGIYYYRKPILFLEKFSNGDEFSDLNFKNFKLSLACCTSWESYDALTINFCFWLSRKTCRKALEFFRNENYNISLNIRLIMSLQNILPELFDECINFSQKDLEFLNDHKRLLHDHISNQNRHLILKLFKLTKENLLEKLQHRSIFFKICTDKTKQKRYKKFGRFDTQAINIF